MTIKDRVYALPELGQELPTMKIVRNILPKVPDNWLEIIPPSVSITITPQPIQRIGIPRDSIIAKLSNLTFSLAQVALAGEQIYVHLRTLSEEKKARSKSLSFFQYELLSVMASSMSLNPLFDSHLRRSFSDRNGSARDIFALWFPWWIFESGKEKIMRENPRLARQMSDLEKAVSFLALK